MNHFLPLCF